MDFGFQVLEQIIKTSAFRHKILASNIANIDTPGYKAKDVSFKESMTNPSLGPSLGLTRTSTMHKQGPNNLRETGGMTAVERASWEDGNNVALDMELAHMTENSLLYEAGAKLLSKKLQMFKNAIKGR